ncbi:MAG: sulfite exporter TauE/SafE family protein [Nitratireductor sp.]|nr:sulfite exporter TauE/SafE family protein [Nitratireductor sp.]
MEGFLAQLSATWSEHTLTELLLANGVIFFATAVQYALGIAFGLIAAPLLALISIVFVPVPVLMLTFVTAVMSLGSEWSRIHWDEVWSAAGGRVIGSILGVMVLSAIPDEKTFMLVFGFTIALAVAVSVSGLRIPFNLFSVGTAGMFSGLSATITSVGGPPMAVVYQRRSAAEARPSLQTYFAVGASISLFILGVSGYVQGGDLARAMLMLPGFAAGYLAGPLLRSRIDRSFRVLLLASAAVSALLLIWRGLS